MKENSKIGHLNMIINLDDIGIGENSSIGRLNWITGFPTEKKKGHFAHQKKRESKLFLGKHSSITKNHHIDCTNKITIGNFVTIAGYSTQFLTHSIDIIEGRQSSSPIEIGDYTFVGTNATILGGAELPSYSILGAKTLLNKKFTEPYCLYAGVPARKVKDLQKTSKYFTRTIGFVE